MPATVIDHAAVGRSSGVPPALHTAVSHASGSCDHSENPSSETCTVAPSATGSRASCGVCSGPVRPSQSSTPPATASRADTRTSVRVGAPPERVSMKRNLTDIVSG
ncbi:hypothetical protein GCM10011509_16070 [Ornithinimicrobium pekingense]|uniref:Uncharacterized protein n=1 Tax=Ornithinimicrobium pekingense TaxID=384677 RepID=A0ABQ2F7J5_9MICO|nr:hypothetical protein GCM10011509_16070 [Ornithinimicrobium pekingense]